MENKRNDNKTLRLVITGLLVAIIVVTTMMFRFPVPMTHGYVHLGDAMIYLGVLVMGRNSGASAAAVGSALADILGGFAMWAPWTLGIKFLMAFVCGLIIEGDESNGITVRKIVGMAAAGVVMTVGYFGAEWIMYGNVGVAFLGIPWNIGQFVVGIAAASAVYAALARSHALDRFMIRK